MATVGIVDFYLDAIVVSCGIGMSTPMSQAYAVSSDQAQDDNHPTPYSVNLVIHFLADRAWILGRNPP